MMSSTGNVTIDPLSSAIPVDNAEIDEVIDLHTGEIKKSAELIGSYRYDEFNCRKIKIRENLKAELPDYICAICSTAVYPVASTKKRFFFRHTHEDGSCTAKTRNGLTKEQIRARKYNGQQESAAHKKIKSIIVNSLRADKSFIQESILTEKRCTSADKDAWRQPDVQAETSTDKFVFEAQLTTTFLDVVISRRIFYRKEGITLVWVLNNFSPVYRRMTTDDMLFSNNSNIFVVDEETENLSKESGCFHLKCHYRKCTLRDNEVQNEWCENIIKFTDLIIDHDNQRIFFYDYENEEKALQESISGCLRTRFINLWHQLIKSDFSNDHDLTRDWHSIQADLLKIGIDIPDNPGLNTFRTLIHAVLSAYEGRPIGWNYKKLIEVAHQLAEWTPENLYAFGCALEDSGNKKLLSDQDTSQKWAAKSRNFREYMKLGDPLYMPQSAWTPLLKFLFPNVGARVEQFLLNHV